VSVVHHCCSSVDFESRLCSCCCCYSNFPGTRQRRRCPVQVLWRSGSWVRWEENNRVNKRKKVKKLPGNAKSADIMFHFWWKYQSTQQEIWAFNCLSCNRNMNFLISSNEQYRESCYVKCHCVYKKIMIFAFWSKNRANLVSFIHENFDCNIRLICWINSATFRLQSGCVISYQILYPR
jgi:hypothetical protein